MATSPQLKIRDGVVLTVSVINMVDRLFVGEKTPQVPSHHEAVL
jgi:hypothetical protein